MNNTTANRSKKNEPIHAPRVVLLFLLVASLCLAQRAMGAAGANDFREAFLRYCDIAAAELNEPARQKPKQIPFYQDSYAVRALVVAYDLTGRTNYLHACRVWSDRMIQYQREMVPPGAYYMNYRRSPGKSSGDWYVADSACIGLGILATAARCNAPADRQRYLQSAQAFTDLVLSRYVGATGGIRNGFWPKSNDEWWCSTGTFAAFLFQLHAETGQARYREAALKAVDWLNAIDLDTAGPMTFKEQQASMPMYLLEAYSVAWPYLDLKSSRGKGAQGQMQKCLDWMAKNQSGQGNESWVDYFSHWGSKMGGLPFHMYVYARQAPGEGDLKTPADMELRYIIQKLDAAPPKLSQLAAFTLFSLAERVQPGAVYRASKDKDEALRKPSP